MSVDSDPHPSNEPLGQPPQGATAPSRDVVVGLDVGGSKASWLVTDSTGATITRGQGTGMQAAQSAPDRVADALFAVVQNLADQLPAQGRWGLVAGLAGAGDPMRARAVEQALVQRFRTVAQSEPGAPAVARVVGDLVVAAAAGLPEPGILLWAGTGSFAVARDHGGQLHRVGGRGAWLGDEGSGVDVVRRAARAAVAGWDGLGPQSPELLRALCHAVGTEDPGRLGVEMEKRSPGEVAGMFPLIASRAKSGDEVAASAMEAAVDALLRLARAATQRAGLQDPVVRCGGGLLADAESGLAPLCFASLRAVGMQVASNPSEPSGIQAPDAAAGAARLALAALREASPAADPSTAAEDALCRRWMDSVPHSGDAASPGAGGSRP